MSQFWLRTRSPGTPLCRSSVSAIVAARRAAPMTAQHAHPEPHQRSNRRDHEGEQPKRPREAPEQEVEPDILGVLDHEGEQEPDPGEGGNRSPAEPGPLSFHGTAPVVTRTLLNQ